MKILYFGNQRLDAQNLATALRSVARKGTVSWTSSLDRAATWFDENRDVAALVVEAQGDGASGASLLQHVRGLALRPALIVVVPEGARTRLGPLAAAADELIDKNSARFHDLPAIITAAVARLGGTHAAPRQPMAAATRNVTTGADVVAAPASDDHGRADLERKLAQATAALREADHKYTTVSEQLAERQVQYELATARTSARWQMVDEQLRTAAIEAESARRDQAAAAAEVDRRARREKELASQLTLATATSDTLTLRIADVEAALEAARARAAEERAAEADERRTLEATLAQTVRARDDAEVRHTAALAGAEAQIHEVEATLRVSQEENNALTQQLADTQAALKATEARAAQEQIAAAEQLATRAREYESRMAARAEECGRVEAALAQALRGRDEAETRRAAAMMDAVAQLRELDAALRLARDSQAATAAEVDRLTAREADLSTKLAAVTADHNTLERRLAATETAFQDADLRATSERLEAARRAAAREAELDAQIWQERTKSASLEMAVAEGESALRAARQEHEWALGKALDELAAHQTRLSDTAADRDRIARMLADAEAALEGSRADHRSAAADVERLARREADLTARVADLTSTLADVQAARQRLEAELADVRNTIAKAAAREAELESRFQQESAARASLEQAIADAENARRDDQQQHEVTRAEAAAERERLSQGIAELERGLEQARVDHQSARTDVARLTRRETDFATQIREVQTARQLLQQQLAEAAKSTADANEQAARDRTQAAEREANLESRLAKAIEARTVLAGVLDETRVAALDARQSAEQQAEQLRAAREEFDRARAAADADIARLTAALEESGRSLDEARAEAEKLPPLQKDLEESRSESARLFQQAGLAMFRCTRRGELTQTNRAGTTLVGRRTIDELRGSRFAMEVFEDHNALSWLIERCLSTRTRESIETTWRRKDGGRLFVRLSAYASSPDVIEIVAEDLTRVQVLQERLGEAHRMEAVGRVASEVAVTCGNLLAGVHDDVQQWMTNAGDSASSRQHGEHLLAELTRATGFLRQLAAYGEEQARTPAMADLNTVIRDLEPVLKRVAGDSVDVKLSDAASRLNVDVGAERIERLLVSLASFGRARMPQGGQLKIELGRTVVDRRFVAKHPNVRLGPHALITVTESRHTGKTDALLELRDTTAAKRAAGGKPDQKPGMDFGTLQGLVGGCGGHLWMTVQPQGDMVAKIHLPLLTPFEHAAPRATALRGVRDRALARLFHH